MVLLKIDFYGIAVFPFKCDAPRPVYVNAVPNGVSVKRMEIEPRQVRIPQIARLIKSVQHVSRALLQAGRDFGTFAGQEQFAQPLVAKAPDHKSSCSTARDNL
ncbi:MAG: hypothetical protein WB999_10515 [Candidatus Binataceae bacterium]